MTNTLPAPDFHQRFTLAFVDSFNKIQNPTDQDKDYFRRVMNLPPPTAAQLDPSVLRISLFDALHAGKIESEDYVRCINALDKLKLKNK